MNMNIKNSKFLFFAILFSTACCLFSSNDAYGQLYGREVRWLRTGSLHHFILNWGAEIEIGRTGDELRNQMDGLRWPAQFQEQDVLVSKSLWIGCTNYEDRNGTTYDHKVIAVGPRGKDQYRQFIPMEFKMVGRFEHPYVYVDGLIATDNDLNDIVDEIDPDLKCDRMIYTRLITYLGIEVKRKAMQFSQQNHDNYIVYDYVFKNTGVVDAEGNSDAKKLTGVYFHFQHRYGSGLELFRTNGAWSDNDFSWGRNCVNQVIGIGPKEADFDHRAFYSWYGPHSGAKVEDDWGGPILYNGKLTAIHYMGSVILHVDTEPGNIADDRSQPSTTMYVASDGRPYNYGTDMFSADKMTIRYGIMSEGHPHATHADQVGDGFANLWGDNDGGYAQGMGFGPYDIEIGDSIHIVFAEGVSGINYRKRLEVGRNWYLHTNNLDNPQLVLPNNTTTNDENLYKRLWVQSGADSIKKTFETAVSNYNKDYDIPLPPPPPGKFTVQSGGNKISLSWENDHEGDNFFNGYEIYRGVGKPDTLYEKIFSCDKSDVVNSYNDKSALRGLDYYYYIVSKDDGTKNILKPGVPLVSSKFYTMTNEPAFLRKPAIKTTLDSIRVVPNPFHANATELQFGVDTPDRIGFYGLPAHCVIKIYTERGDLIDEIEHTDGTADELWDSLTLSRQIIVSGVYIAYFEVTKDLYSETTGELLLKKGDNKIRKFFIVR